MQFLRAMVLLLAAHTAAAQRWTAPATLLTDPTVENDRSRMLRSDSASLSMFRSPSTMTRRLGDSGFRAGFVLPHVQLVHNSDLPYSLNDGALWSGRGTNTDVIAGGRLEWGRLRILVLPELVISANDSFDVTVPDLFPTVNPPRQPWASPFHYGSQSIDLPIRFGDRRIERLYPGQSALVVEAGPIEVGGGTENEWWGPGMRNALLLSNNAAGFPHLFLRTGQPIETPVGSIEARWMAGGLNDSHFFYEGSGNFIRQIALLGVSLEPRGVDGLTLGAARAVFGPMRSWGSAMTSFFHVFRDVGQPDARPLIDFTAPSGSDQLLSLFGRWVFPKDGFEVYGEWGRAEFPKSVRDFLEMPNHTQAYVLGLQWLGDSVGLTRGSVRVQSEVSFLQQSTTYRFRPIGSWYTSAVTGHGYTQQGQVIGAGIGPGSSSQWIAIDHMASSWSVGSYVNRIRWLEDARSQAFVGLPLGNGWCEHDVSLLGGLRGSFSTRAGAVSLDYSTGWRDNVFFNHDRDSCPFNQGKDIRNKSLTMTFSPASFRF